MRALALAPLLPLVAALPLKPWLTKRLGAPNEHAWSSWGHTPLVSLHPRSDGGACDADAAPFQCGGPNYQFVQCESARMPR